MKAFTMIELIFVIVIIGILAAVAIPKLSSTADQAKNNMMLAFVGTLNRTVGPILWSNHLEDKGSVKTVTLSEFLSVYTAVPEGVENIDLSQCADANASTGSKIADITILTLSVAEEIFCIDGSTIESPRFAFSADMNDSLQNNSYDV